MVEKYPGQVKLVFKNYPLRGHKFARPAATAALAAHTLNRFWEFHDALFTKTSGLNEKRVEKIRDDLGLDKAAFDAQRKSPMVVAQLNKDIRLAKSIGVNATPSVFINGRLQRKRNLESFSAAVDAELKRLAK